MATAAVLQPFDINILVDRSVAFHASQCTLRSTPSTGRKPISRPKRPNSSAKRQQWRRSLLDDEKRKIDTAMKNTVCEVKELVMEKVRILKRGEKLSTDFVKCNSAAAVVVDKSFSECKKNGFVLDGFAGDGFTALAPLPGKVPMPKKILLQKGEVDRVDASLGLRMEYDFETGFAMRDE